MTDYPSFRNRMVEEQIKGRGVREKKVLNAMLKIPRHLFVDESLREKAYDDHPLPIGEGQTISQPYMVALMTNLLQLRENDRVLEIGTGSGYQTAVLSTLALNVFTVERIESLSKKAEKVLDSLGINNVEFRVSDGTRGWPEKALFDGIIITAGSPDTPKAYFKQLAENGRLVIPVGGEGTQTLYRYKKTGKDFQKERITNCIFVKLIGKFGWSDS